MLEQTAFPGGYDEAELLKNVCSLMAADRHYRMAAIAVAHSDGSVFPIAGAGAYAQFFADHPARWDDSPAGMSTAGVALKRNQTVINDAGDSRIGAFPFRLGHDSAVFVAQAPSKLAFDTEEIAIIEGACNALATMIASLRFREEQLIAERDRANHAEQRLAALWKIAGSSPGNDDDAFTMAREILVEGCGQLDASFGYIGRIEGDQLIVELLTGYEEQRVQEGQVMALEQTFAQRLLQAQRTLADNTQSHTRTLRTVGSGTIHVPVNAYIGTPFRVGNAWHILCFGNTDRRPADFSIQDERYVELMASVFARTLQQRETLKRMLYLQDHDALTELPNRNRFHVRLAELLTASDPESALAVVIVDTDKFRVLVEELGPEAGDQIVVELAQRVKLAKSDDHELFRYRSDSFALIVHGPRAPHEVHFLAERIIASIHLPFKVFGEEARISASIGIALSPSDGADVSTLSIAAGTAMRRAKRAGHGQFRFYNEMLDERFGRRRLVAEELQNAVRNNELVLYYQPIIGMHDGEVIGAEALVRWHHPRRGILGANEFIQIAEESDLINEIGAWVFATAAHQAQRWNTSLKPIVVAINLSARQFNDPGLLADVESAIRASGVPPSMLEFEVTESIAMRDPAAAAYMLGCFRDMGLRVALDDFGTGHSSLAYLKHFPIDIIKLDQAFVAGLPKETADAAIARAVVELARSIGCEVRAEGIELASQAAWLRSVGVHSAQGFWIAPPLMPAALERWLDQRGPGMIVTA